MSLTFVTYADLGKRENMKTPAALPIIRKFEKEGELDLVVCRTAKDFYYKKTISAVPIFIRYILHGIKLVFKKFRLRAWEEKIFDFRTAKMLGKEKDSIVLFHPLSFPRSIKKAKEKGLKTIGWATNAHPLYVEKVTKKEIELLGLEKMTKKAEQEHRKYAQMYKSHDYIIVYTEVCKRQVIAYGDIPEDKIFVAPLDVNFEKFKSVYDNRKRQIKDKFSVLYVGNIRAKKGIHYLLKAWRNVKIENKELLLVGYFMASGKLRKIYEEMINNDPTIKILGFKKDIYNYYEKADVFVFPSLSEGLGRAVLEAMFCGIPVITTENAPAIIEDGKTGFIVPICNSEIIKEKIEYLYENKEKRKEMGEKAREDLLNKEPFEDQVFEIYQEIKKREKLI